MGIGDILNIFKKKDKDIVQSKPLKYEDNNVYIALLNDDDKEQKYRVKLDSIESFKKMNEMQDRINLLSSKLNDNPNIMIELVSNVKDVIVMMLGYEAYKEIFNTQDKKDNWSWHISIFSEIFKATIQYQEYQFAKIFNSEALEKVKEIQTIQANLSREQRRKIRK